MAHFAKLDSDYNVIEVLRVADEELLGSGLQEVEAKGQEFLRQLHNEPTAVWKQTSYNTWGGVHYDPDTDTPSTDQTKTFRKNYACVGGYYDPELDAFVPVKTYPSWVLNEESCLWEPPVPYPDDGGVYVWDEGSVAWVSPQDPTTINVNTADFETLRALHGVDEVRAQAIIDGRPWEDTNDLTSIQGISQEMVDSWDIMV